jgi:hypothetical protein
MEEGLGQVEPREQGRAGPCISQKFRIKEITSLTAPPRLSREQ